MVIEFIKELSKEEVLDWQEIYKEDLKFSKSKKLTYAERKKLPDSAFAVVITVKKKKGEGTRKIRMFPIHDEAHVRNALARLGQTKVRATLRSLGVSVEKVMKKVLRRAKELGMKQLLEKHKSSLNEEGLIERLEKELNESRSSVATLSEELKKAEEEKAKIKQKVEELESEVNKRQKELEEAEEKINLYKEKGKTIAERRAELGNFAKNLSDDDLLDETKYELARLKKENFELRNAKQDLNTGHDGTDEDKMREIREKVRERKQY